MAIRILPFRQYAEEDVVNLFANSAANNAVSDSGDGDAGVFVQVTAGDLSLDPIQYETNSYLGKTDYPFIGRDQYPVVPLKVSAADTDNACLGMTLLQTAQTDENGEKLLYYPQKKLETQSVLTGEAVPILTKGVVTLAASTNVNGASATVGDLTDFAPGNWLVISSATNGKVSGCAQDDAGWTAGATGVGGAFTSALANRQKVGQVLGTGIRTNRGVASDQFSGPSVGTGAANASGHYIIARIDCGN
jgi:sarcosine oxidase gamma subunit